MKKLFYVGLLLMFFSVNAAYAQDVEEAAVAVKKNEIMLDLKPFFSAIMGSYSTPVYNLYLLRNIKGESWIRLGVHAEMGNMGVGQQWWDKIHLNDSIAIQPYNPVESFRGLISLGYERRPADNRFNIFYGASIFAGQYKSTDETIVSYYSIQNNEYDLLREDLHSRVTVEQLQFGVVGYIGARVNIFDWLAASANIKAENYFATGETTNENFLSGESFVNQTGEYSMNMPGLIGEVGFHYRF